MLLNRISNHSPHNNLTVAFHLNMRKHAIGWNKKTLIALCLYSFEGMPTDKLKISYSKDVDGSLINVEGNYLSFGYVISIARTTLDRSNIVMLLNIQYYHSKMLKAQLNSAKCLRMLNICYTFAVSESNKLNGHTLQGSTLTINGLIKTINNKEKHINTGLHHMLSYKVF